MLDNLVKVLSSIMVSMNRLDTARRVQIVRCLVEGCSVRSTVRTTGASKNTIAKLSLDLGEACSKYMSEHLSNLPCQRLQIDEIWSFAYSERRNVEPSHLEDDSYAGDVWTWFAIDPDTRLIPSFMIGRRDTATAHMFIEDLASRLANRVQLSNDGNKAYLSAVKAAFRNHIDYATLVEIYGNNSEGQKRCGLGECTGCEKPVKDGPGHEDLRYIDRHSFGVRLHNRSFTRLTNAFSKKVENHLASLAIHYMHYNFVRIHQLLRATPAAAAGISGGVSGHPRSVEDIISLLSISEH